MSLHYHYKLLKNDLLNTYSLDKRKLLIQLESFETKLDNFIIIPKINENPNLTKSVIKKKDPTQTTISRIQMIFTSQPTTSPYEILFRSSIDRQHPAGEQATISKKIYSLLDDSSTYVFTISRNDGKIVDYKCNVTVVNEQDNTVRGLSKYVKVKNPNGSEQVDNPITQLTLPYQFKQTIKYYAKLQDTPVFHFVIKLIEKSDSDTQKTDYSGNEYIFKSNPFWLISHIKNTSKNDFYAFLNKN